MQDKEFFAHMKMSDILKIYYEKVLETERPPIAGQIVDQLEANHKIFWNLYSASLRWNTKIRSCLEIVRANLQNSQRILKETYVDNEPRKLDRHIDDALKIIDHEFRDMEFNIYKQKLNPFDGQDVEYVRRLAITGH